MKITLKNLHEATAQQVFDQVANHLLTQKRKSIGSEGLCMYSGSDGLKCAAGCLMTDDEYEESMEGREWHELIDIHDIPIKHSTLIENLQVLHDSTSVDSWKEQLEILATENNLEFKF